jgi:uncharacterized membrane protein
MVGVDLKRLCRHLFTTHWQLGRAFPDATMRAIEQAIAAGERETSGELRFVVESALPAAALLAGESARDRALALFSDLHVWDTAENNGVLIYVLLADRAVNATLGTDVWLAVCHTLEAAFAEGRFQAGAIAAVEDLTRQLKAHFPPAPDQRNELPDRPLVISPGRAQRVAH